jgi:hypothetical protein
LLGKEIVNHIGEVFLQISKLLIILFLSWVFASRSPDNIMFSMLFVCLVSSKFSDAIAQVIRYWLFIVELWVQPQMISCEIRVDRVAVEKKVFLPAHTSGFPC